MLWQALGNLFFTVDCLTQPKYSGEGCLVLCNLIGHTLLIPMGELPLSEQKQEWGVDWENEGKDTE